MDQGCFSANLKKKNSTKTELIFVVKNLQTPLVGRPAIEAFKLVTQIKSVTRNEASVISKFPELFKGLGKISGDYCIQMEENAKPYSIYMPRRVPIPLLPKVVKQDLGVISEIDKPTDWCSGMVVVPKQNEKVRICVDLTRLNQYVKQERHILPSIDHVMGQVGDAKIFSKLNANSEFYRTCPRVSKTHHVPFGMYYFNRLPFGITSAPEFFQKQLSEILRGCEGVVRLVDDVLVYDRNAEEHHGRLMAVLEILKNAGVTLDIFFTPIVSTS